MGITGHAESVQVVYDPVTIPYEILLDAYWHNIDPTSGGGQFCDTARRSSRHLRRRRGAKGGGGAVENHSNNRVGSSGSRRLCRRPNSGPPRLTTSTTTRRTPPNTRDIALPAAATPGSANSGATANSDHSFPIDSHVDLILEDARRSRAAIVTAAPGAGKTTRVPPALMARRRGHPAPAAPRRRPRDRGPDCAERGWTLGREVGWDVRSIGGSPRHPAAGRDRGHPHRTAAGRSAALGFPRRRPRRVSRAQHPCRSRAALARQAWRASHGLRIVVMSATSNGPGFAFLDSCPVVVCPGACMPPTSNMRPGIGGGRCGRVFAVDRRTVLCFLPGARGNRPRVRDIHQRGPGVEVLPLHGSLDADAQDPAISAFAVRPRHRRDQHRRDVAHRAGRHGRLDSGQEKVARMTRTAASTASRPTHHG